ncbi:MAG: VRR-NUC domain-containing protein [Bacteroidales bacterium]
MPIDLVVRGRCGRGNKVLYPTAATTKKDGQNEVQWLIPESTVLYRWRQRRNRRGATRHGFRLPPGTWKTVLACHLDWQTASVEQVKQARAAFRAKNPTVDSPGPANLCTLVRYLLGRGVLDKILDHHRADRKSPGIPDLFLFRLSKTKRLHDAKFVEVKKPDEQVLPSQHKEIEFLQSIGLQAGIVRLDEQWLWPQARSKTDTPPLPQAASGRQAEEGCV